MRLLHYTRISFGALVVAGAVLLAGCGGGVSPLGVSYTLPDVPTTAVAITDINARAVANDALAGSAGSASAGIGGVSGVAVEGGSTTKVKLHLDAAINMANKVLIDQYSAPQLPAGASQSFDCAGGGTITLTTEGNDSRITFDNCGDPLDVVIDGAFAATNVSFTGEPPTPPFSLSVIYSYSLTFTYDSGASSIAMMGRFDVAMAVDINDVMTASVSNGEMGITNGIDSVVMTNINNTQSCNNWDSVWAECLDILTISNNYTVGGTASNGTFTVTTTTPLEINLGLNRTYPYMGVIEVTADVAGAISKLRITINDDEAGGTPQITVAIDANGDDVYDNGGTYDPVNLEYDW